MLVKIERVEGDQFNVLVYESGHSHLVGTVDRDNIYMVGRNGVYVKLERDIIEAWVEAIRVGYSTKGVWIWVVQP